MNGVMGARAFRAMAIAMVLAMAAAGCASGQSASESSESEVASPAGLDGSPSGDGSDAGGAAPGTLTIAIDAPMDTLDPAAQNSTGVMMRVMTMVESLTWLDEEGQLQPLLATEWEASEDGLTWTFTLRDDVTFHDGETFNAEAVKFSLDRLLDPDTEAAQAGTFSQISEVRVVDDTHVEIVTDSPYPVLPRVLSQPMAGIISPASVEVAPNTLAHIEEPVGTGPYMFESHSADEALVVKANRNYWGDAPTYETQRWEIIPDASSRQAMLQTGEADIVWNPPAASLPSLTEDESVRLEPVEYPGTLLININTQSDHQPLLQDPEVRKALSHAVNPDVLIDQLLSGAGIPAHGPVPSSMFGDCDEAGHYEYDRDLARQMLADAGADGMEVTFYVPQGRYLNDFTVGEAIAGQLREVGLDVTIKPPTDFATFLGTVWSPLGERPDDIDLMMIGSGAVHLDASKAMYNFHSESLPPNGYNGALYENPQLDEVLNEADRTVNTEERAELLCEGQRILIEDAPAIWMYTPTFPTAMSSELDGLVSIPNGMIFANWVDQA